MRTKPLENARVAIVHDWMNGFRGGEQVLDALVEIFPNAELFTLFYTPGSLNPRIEERKIHASFLNRIPFSKKIYRHLLPLFPMAIEHLDLSGFDLILSSSHCVAKGIIPPPEALHICYCHTPIRYAWDRYGDYFRGSKLEPLIYPFIHYIRTWDTASSHRVDAFIANSNYVAQRISKYYGRHSTVIYPPVSVERFSPCLGDKGDYYLVVSAFGPYKRIDLAIEACERMGRKLFIVGDGQEKEALRKLAGPHTTFLGRIPNSELSDILSGARALLFPGEEDFGITPLEAMAAGTPVIALGKGGAVETVIPGETGVLFDSQSVECLIHAIKQFENFSFETETLTAWSARFSRTRFQNEIRTYVASQWNRQGLQESLPISQRPEAAQ